VGFQTRAKVDPSGGAGKLGKPAASLVLGGVADALAAGGTVVAFDFVGIAATSVGVVAGRTGPGGGVAAGGFATIGADGAGVVGEAVTTAPAGFDGDVGGGTGGSAGATLALATTVMAGAGAAGVAAPAAADVASSAASGVLKASRNMTGGASLCRVVRLS
jgi:hypothetical protein